MPRRLEWDSLSPAERKIAHLHYAGASEATIGYLAETSQATVEATLKRPHVANYLIKLAALNGDELGPSIQSLNEAIETEAERAFQVEREAMERLFALDDPADRRFVHATVASANIAQDILDRAGKRAPTKIAQTVSYGIDEKTRNVLDRVLRESAGVIDVTPGENGNDSTTSGLPIPVDRR